MTSDVLRVRSAPGLALPAALLLVLFGVLGVQTGIVAVPTAFAVKGPETVVIATRPFAYRAAGEFLLDGASVDGPLVRVEAPVPLEIMIYQVSAADYARCVADGACASAEPRRRSMCARKQCCAYVPRIATAPSLPSPISMSMFDIAE